MARSFVTALTLSNVSRDGILERARRGKSAIKRAAIAPGSRCADGPSGSAAINEANLCVAVSLGNRANLSASCQGSISNRASAETTLSGMSFRSSPIGANRKSSNSGPRSEPKAERVISTTDCVASIGHIEPTMEHGQCCCTKETKPHCTAVFHVRLGNYIAGLANRCFSASIAFPNFCQSPCCIAFWASSNCVLAWSVVIPTVAPVTWAAGAA
jgi:hypothetical protein